MVEQLREELPGLHTFVTLSPVPGFRRWLQDSEAAARLDELVEQPDELLRACARYLTTLGEDGRPVDPVARFHMGNGARLFDVGGADRSERGMDRSFGIMANYRYEPEDRAENAASLHRGRPALGDSVADLLTRS